MKPFVLYNIEPNIFIPFGYSNNFLLVIIDKPSSVF